MNIQIIKTFAELKQVIVDFVAKHKIETTVDDAKVLWFVAIQEARIYSELRTKDIADILLYGTKPITIEYVDEWLGTLFQEVIETIEMGEEVDEEYNDVPNLNEMCCDFFGVREKEEDDEE